MNTTYFNLDQIRLIFKTLSDNVVNIITSDKDSENKATIINESEQKCIIIGNKTVFCDLVRFTDFDEEWMIEVHDNLKVYEYTFPNVDTEDAIDYILKWLFIDDRINDLVFTEVKAN